MRALFSEGIILNAPVLKHRGLGRSVVDRLRGAVIKAAEESGVFSEEEMNLINFKPKDWRTPPTILFGQPAAGSNKITLYGRGSEGVGIIERLGEVLVSRRFMEIGDQAFIVKRKEEIKIEPFLPSRLPGDEERRYYMVTPAIFYDKKREHGEWLAISKKYRESDPLEYDRQMKRSIANLFRANILYQVKHVIFPGGQDNAMSSREGRGVLKKLEEDFSIEIDRFHFKIDYYHRDMNMTPMLFLHFRSQYEIPRFVGHHVGRGYGLVGVDRREKSGEENTQTPRRVKIERLKP